MKKSDLRPPLRAHAVSAGLGALYAACLCLAVWVAFALTYLATPANGAYTAVVLVPVCVMLIGLIVFVVVKSIPPEALTFYGVLLLTHILLAILFAHLARPVTAWLDGLRGIAPPAGELSPDGNLNGFYFLLNWIFLTVGMGTLLFILSVAFYLRDVLRKVMGYLPKEKKHRRSGGDKA